MFHYRFVFSDFACPQEKTRKKRSSKDDEGEGDSILCFRFLNPLFSRSYEVLRMVKFCIIRDFVIGFIIFCDFWEMEISEMAYFLRYLILYVITRHDVNNTS